MLGARGVVRSLLDVVGIFFSTMILITLRETREKEMSLGPRQLFLFSLAKSNSRLGTFYFAFFLLNHAFIGSATTRLAALNDSDDFSSRAYET